MKIISFKASNFKKLTAIEINPEGDVITLTGENGAGKSSILDGIEATLCGKKVMDEKPIREGAKRAELFCELPGLKVTRRITPNSDTLRVENAEGEPRRNPQAILDSLVGNLAFDPMAFSRMKPKEQSEALRQLVGLSFGDLDQARQKAYDDRTVSNREVDRLKALLDTLSPHDPEAPKELLLVELAVDQLKLAEEENAKVTLAQKETTVRLNDNTTRVEAAERNLLEAEASEDEAKKQIAEWKAILDARIKTCSSCQDSLAKARTDRDREAEEHRNAKPPVFHDLEAMRAKIIACSRLNDVVKANKARKETEVALEEARKASDVLSDKIEELDHERTTRLAATKFPLPGLAFDEAGVSYGGIPFSQISDGEKLRISVAIGMATNPALRVIFVRDGSLLDAAGLKLIAELAKEHKYQVWMEDSRSTDAAALMIEDGHIKGLA